MELRHKYDLAILLNCLDIARSSFYYYSKQTGNTDKYSETKEMIQRIYHKHKGRLGYRRITLLLRQQGQVINHKTVLRLMRLLNLKSVIRIKKYKSYKGEHGKIAPNVLQRLPGSAPVARAAAGRRRGGASRRCWWSLRSGC